jgi:DNA processing protein
LARPHPKPGHKKSDPVRSSARLSPRQRVSWLRLIRSENVGPVTFRALVNQFGGAEAAIAALPALSRRGGYAQAIRVCTLAEAAAELAAAERLGANLVAMGSRAIHRHWRRSTRRRR